MPLRPRSIFSYSSLALGGALLWGMIELVALWRSRWVARTHAKV